MEFLPWDALGPPVRVYRRVAFLSPLSRRWGGIVTSTHGTHAQTLTLASHTARAGHLDLLAQGFIAQQQAHASMCAVTQGGKQGTYGPPPGLADRQEGWSFYLTEREISCSALCLVSGLGGAADGHCLHI